MEREKRKTLVSPDKREEGEEKVEEIKEDVEEPTPGQPTEEIAKPEDVKPEEEKEKVPDWLDVKFALENIDIEFFSYGNQLLQLGLKQLAADV